MAPIAVTQIPTEVGVYEDSSESDLYNADEDSSNTFDNDVIELDFDNDDFEDPVFETQFELDEAERLMNLVKASFPAPNDENKTVQKSIKTTTITDDKAIREAKKRRKRLKKYLKAVNHLKEKQAHGSNLNEEQIQKLQKESGWLAELESLEHNLM